MLRCNAETFWSTAEDSWTGLVLLLRSSNSRACVACPACNALSSVACLSWASPISRSNASNRARKPAVAADTATHSEPVSSILRQRSNCSSRVASLSIKVALSISCALARVPSSACVVLLTSRALAWCSQSSATFPADNSKHSMRCFKASASTPNSLSCERQALCSLSKVSCADFTDSSSLPCFIVDAESMFSKKSKRSLRA
mmetsp:Transcript_11465/g.31012  ORF Transcript_11465/g.31012 Transcript_11465/m.31012 type:complete len:202 (-) Transcript_11465:1689-2294(-)